MRRTGKAWFSALLVAGGSVVGASRLQHPVPVAAHAETSVQGAALFASSGCTHCHGNDGQGTDKAPSVRDLRKKLSADKITDQIVHGGQGMPAFGEALKPEEVQELVAFLRSKKWVTPPATADKPATPSQPS